MEMSSLCGSIIVITNGLFFYLLSYLFKGNSPGRTHEYLADFKTLLFPNSHFEKQRVEKMNWKVSDHACLDYTLCDLVGRLWMAVETQFPVTPVLLTFIQRLHPAWVVQKALNISCDYISCNPIGRFLLFEWLNFKTGVLPSTWFNFDLVLLLSLWFWWVLYYKTQFCADICISCLLHNLFLNILVPFCTGCFFLELSSLSSLLFLFTHKICFDATVCSAA